MKTLTLVLENQLFENYPELDTPSDFVIVESIWLATRLPYHKFRLAYVLTCQREYRDYLETKGCKVHYFTIDSGIDFEKALKTLSSSYQKLQYCAVADKFLELEIARLSALYFTKTKIMDSLMFLTSKHDFGEYLANLANKKLVMRDFYAWQRRRLGILVNEQSGAVGGSWSLDTENRLKLPKNQPVPIRMGNFKSEHYEAVVTSVNTLFADNPGIIGDLWLPVNMQQTRKFWLDFLNQSLVNFGPYEDSITGRDDYLFHSLISAPLNLGLTTPRELLDMLDQFLVEKHTFSIYQNDGQIPKFFNSIEGLIRQIIGWREWIKGLYDHKYDANFVTLNFFDSKNPLPSYFYHPSQSPELKANLPLYESLTRVERLAWTHHIERLMIIANWMTLNCYDPAECYTWFASQFVDASEWVMVANVMGMGLFADGGIFATKPYISGGNYIKKMSDYSSAEWEKLWTDKFWEFLIDNQTYFKSQPRLNMLLQSKLKTLQN